MTIKVVDELHESLVDNAWQMYYDAFAELNALAVQRHLMYRSEFEAVMFDPRIQKYLSLDDAGVLDGLAIYTNDLEAVPLISPQYFQRRWPERYAQRRVWYVGFVAVRPDARCGSVFIELIRAMYEIAVDNGGVVGIDMCRYNDEQHRMSRAVNLLVKRFYRDVRTERMDEQSYWLFEFPSVHAPAA